MGKIAKHAAQREQFTPLLLSTAMPGYGRHIVRHFYLSRLRFNACFGQLCSTYTQYQCNPAPVFIHMPTYILNEDTQPAIRAIGVSHTACKDEFRLNIRSHSWSAIFFLQCNTPPCLLTRRDARTNIARTPSYIASFHVGFEIVHCCCCTWCAVGR